MQNKLTDLNNYLFEALERLNDPDASPEELDREMKRAKAVTNVAQAIIYNANTLLNAAKLFDEQGVSAGENSEALKLLGAGK